MSNRLRLLVALLAVALQAVDALVGALGHSHAHQAFPCAADACASHEHALCGHTHAPGTSDSSAEHQQPDDSSDSHDSHDDCALCRHFSQPVTPVAMVLVLPPSVRIEPLVERPAARALPVAARMHDARGPPRECV